MDPKDVLNNPENIQLLINMLQQLLPAGNANQPTQPTEAKQPTLKNKPIKTKGSRRRSVESESFENRFTAMAEFTMHKEDASIDKKLAKHPPVARMREFDPVVATCRVCGKTEEISPALLFEGAARYKCNNCSTNAG